MKSLIVLFILAVLLFTSGEETTPVVEIATELCGNSTEDSCEAFNSTESVPTSLDEEEVTKAPVVTKKPKATTTVKSVFKKTSGASNNTTKHSQSNPDCTCDATVSIN